MQLQDYLTHSDSEREKHRRITLFHVIHVKLLNFYFIILFGGGRPSQARIFAVFIDHYLSEDTNENLNRY